MTQTPDQRAWAILDNHLYGYCTLPDDNDPSSLLPLEWRSRHGADAWLQRCYMAWERGSVPPPEAWRPLSDKPSPWAVQADPERPALPGFLTMWAD